LSRSPPPSFDEIETNVQALLGTSDALGLGAKDSVPLEATGFLILGTLSLRHHFLQYLAMVNLWRIWFSSSHRSG
jgi:hypothetical protein